MTTPAISFRLPPRIVEYLDKECEATGKTRIQFLVEMIDFYRSQNDEQLREKQETKEKLDAMQTIIKAMHNQYGGQLLNLNERIQKIEETEEKRAAAMAKRKAESETAKSEADNPIKPA